MKRFLYLVQTKSELPPAYAPLRSEDSDVLVLTWGSESPGCVYLPRSSWNQGRNRLRQEALREGSDDHLYYIFLDDDLVLTRGDWRLFEQALLKYEPAVAAPYWSNYAAMRGSNLALEAHPCTAFDAMCSAFHREVFRDDLILPYREDFDKESWWVSQWFVIQLTRLFLRRNTLQINTVHVDNLHHSDYPSTADFHALQERFYREAKPFGSLLARLLPARWTATLYLALVRLRWLGWDRYHLSYRRPTDCYAIPAQKKRRRLDPDAELWRGRL